MTVGAEAEARKAADVAVRKTGTAAAEAEAMRAADVATRVSGNVTNSVTPAGKSRKKGAAAAGMTENPRVPFMEKAETAAAGANPWWRPVKAAAGAKKKRSAGSGSVRKAVLHGPGM